MNRIEKIIEAAMSLFASEGFENASVQDIADKAGVAAGTIIYHFKSKNNLLFIVIREILSNLVKETEKNLCVTAKRMEEIELFVRTFFSFFHSNREALLAYTKANPYILLEMSNFPNADLNILLRRYCSLFENMVRRGVASNEFAEIQVAPFASMAVLMLFATASAGMFSSSLSSLEDEALTMLRSRLLLGDVG